MPKVKYKVELQEAEEAKLKDIVKKGNHSAREICHAQVLLHSSDAKPGEKKDNRELAEWMGISPTTVNTIRRTYATEGLDAALQRKTRITPPNAAKITGDVEARVIATALGPPPDGYARWTLRLLSEATLDNQYLVTLSHTSIGEMLNSNQLKPHLSRYWCIPKQNDASYVACMEDVLHIYQLPYNPDVPVLCMDEKPVQLLGEVRERIGAKPMRVDPETELLVPGYCERIDDEYVRCGTASIFMFTEPLRGWRFACALPSRTRTDYAVLMRKVLEEFYPDTERVILVSDNLNTHNKASFYHTFPPEIASKMGQKLDMHYTPPHGSWLNIAECELSAMTRQCLGNRRIDNIEDMNSALSDYAEDRNRRQIGVDWQFTADNARTKLKRLYPTPVFNK